MSLIPTIVSWYGGKNKLAHQIISIMPEHEHYVEVFMGSAATFFSKPKVPRNVLNDINGHLVNLFVQVRDHYEELAEKCYWTLYSREEYKKFYRLYQDGFVVIDDITRAMMYSFLVRANFNNMIGLGFSASIESNSANFNLALLQRMKLAREKLDSVVIENRSFGEIIEKYDVPDTLIYLDPPYYVTLEEVHYYEHVFSELQHFDLAYRLKKCKAPWILSYDDVPEIVELYKDFFIQRTEVKYSTNNSTQKVKKVSELLITNFRAKRPQLDIFDEAPETDFSFQEVNDEEKQGAETEVKLRQEKQYENQLKTEKEYGDNRYSQQTETEQLGLFGQ